MSKGTNPRNVGRGAREADIELIKQIAERAARMYVTYGNFVGDVRKLQVGTLMDVSAVHMHGCRLRLADLLTADDANFAHDIAGINKHLNRETYALEDGFRPRFAA